MTIRKNIQDVITQIQIQRATQGGASSIGDDIQREAQAAILAGQGQPPGQITTEWRTYMLRFAGSPNTNPQELARLLPTDGTHTGSTDNDNRQKERAYLLANGTCGATTTDNLTNGGVTDFLDKDLA
jgi:hypothetical protein